MDGKPQSVAGGASIICLCCLWGLTSNNAIYCNLWGNRWIRMACYLFLKYKMFMCVCVCVCSGKQPRATRLEKSPTESYTSRLSVGQTSQSAGMRKNTGLPMLSTVTHKDIPRQLHVVMSSWLSTDQSALVCCGQRASDDNLENDKFWVWSYRVARFHNKPTQLELKTSLKLAQSCFGGGPLVKIEF